MEAELADLEKGGEKKLKDADAASASSEESGRKSAFGLSIPRRDRKDANAGRVAPNDAAQKPADERSISEKTVSEKTGIQGLFGKLPKKQKNVEPARVEAAPSSSAPIDWVR
ncbi:MAG TPA: hypothetical protein VI565_09925, partial [Burkholderiales bacterium]|nr:hypothetical protein [Burkholderiales bacterium]